MLQLAIIWKYPDTAKILVLAGELERGRYFLKGKASDVSELMTACWASVVDSWLAPRTDCVAIGALERKDEKSDQKSLRPVNADGSIKNRNTKWF